MPHSLACPHTPPLRSVSERDKSIVSVLVLLVGGFSVTAGSLPDPALQTLKMEVEWSSGGHERLIAMGRIDWLETSASSDSPKHYHCAHDVFNMNDTGLEWADLGNATLLDDNTSSTSTVHLFLVVLVSSCFANSCSSRMRQSQLRL